MYSPELTVVSIDSVKVNCLAESCFTGNDRCFKLSLMASGDIVKELLDSVALSHRLNVSIVVALENDGVRNEMFDIDGLYYVTDYRLFLTTGYPTIEFTFEEKY